MDEYRVVTIDPVEFPQPVYSELTSGYTYQVELCYDVRVSDESETGDCWGEKSLFMASLPISDFPTEGQDRVWRPLEDVGVSRMSRPYALMVIKGLLAARLPDDLNGFTSANEMRLAILKLSACVSGLHFWEYGMDSGIKGHWKGLRPRISLHNLIGGENKREHTWNLVLHESQPFVFDDPGEPDIATIIQHKGKEIYPLQEPPKVMRRYTRRNKEG